MARGVALATLALAGLSVAACAPPEPAPRNLILLLPDTLRADHLGTYGYSRNTSPVLDSLGEAGVVFENAVSQASCTYPSVNSILTSRYPLVFLGRPVGDLGIPEGIPSLAEILDAQGFDTVGISASPIVRKNPSVFNKTGGFDVGFDVFDDDCQVEPATCVHDKALEHLPSGEKPFFLYLHYMDPHDPYMPPAEYRGQFAQPYEGPHEFIGRGDPNPIGRMLYFEGSEVEVSAEDLDHLRDLYDEAIAFLDLQVGIFLAELRARGLLEETLIAVVSDHGEEFLEHGHIKHCRTVFDTEIQTPFLLAGPGIEGGRRVPEVVENVDLVPTVLDYLGVDYLGVDDLGVDDLGVEAPGAGFEGISLRPRIEGRQGSDAARNGEDSARRGGFTWQGRQRSLTEERFKLIYYLGDRWELFDRLEDPGETHDVLEANRRTFARMRQDLTRWMQQVEPQRFEDGVTVGEDFEKKMRALGYLN